MLSAVCGVLVRADFSYPLTIAGNPTAPTVSSRLTAIPAQFHGAWTGDSSGVLPREVELPIVVASRKDASKMRVIDLGSPTSIIVEGTDAGLAIIK